MDKFRKNRQKNSTKIQQKFQKIFREFFFLFFFLVLWFHVQLDNQRIVCLFPPLGQYEPNWTCRSKPTGSA
jgi:hypothetical protein